MSTKFVIVIKPETNEMVEIDNPAKIRDMQDDPTYEITPIVHRINKTILFYSRIAMLLPPETKIYPIDNSAQGIYTIGDALNMYKANNQ